MTDTTAPELDPRSELASLVASTRALLEQYEASGADLVPGAGVLPVVQETPARAEPAGVTVPRPEAPAPTPSPIPAPRFEAPAPTPSPIPAPRFEAPAPTPSPIPAPRFEAPAPTPSPIPAPRFEAPAPTPSPIPAPRFEAPAPAPARFAAPAPAPRVEAPASARVVESAAATDDRRMRLALLAEEVRPCTRCVLCESRTQTVFARGNPFAELCFVGEGPGADEDAQGEPFVGAAGQLLDRMIAAMGYRRDDVYICNIVKCRPPKNRKPEPAEMDACAPYLREQLAIVKPKVIVALGATAVSGLLGTAEGITRLRGKWKLYKGTIAVMPTFHPAYLLRTPAAKREVWSDLQEVMKHLGKPLSKGGGDARGRGDE